MPPFRLRMSYTAQIATRHIILIRHGQYDETHKEDELRTLTSLGRAQAQKTGERLREIFAESESPICLRCSTMTRAKETCEIISHFLPQGTKFLGFDPGLAEGRPAQPIPGRPFQESVIDVDGPRIEAAFRSLFYRSTEPTNSGHNFDIVVCHGNVRMPPYLVANGRIICRRSSDTLLCAPCSSLPRRGSGCARSIVH